MGTPAEQGIANCSPDELLRAAIQRRDAAATRHLLQSHPELRDHLNEPTFGFDAPALVACAGDAGMVDVLLDFGADPNRRSDWWAGGFHALYWATGATAERLLAAGAIPDACAAAHLDRLDLLRQLIAEDPARVHERGGDGQLPLHFAASRGIIDLLLAAGADIDARDVDHRSTAAEWMLQRARGAGRYHLAEYLVERGASTDVFLATALGLTDRVRAMLEANPELLDLRTGRGPYGEQPPSSYHISFWTIGDSRSPMDVAGQFEHQDTLDMLLERASPLQRFICACRQANEEQATALVRAHPGLIASMGADDHRAITDAAWNDDTRAIELMVTLGFDPHTPGHDAGTALHCAAWSGSPDAVQAILRHPDASVLVTLRDAHYDATPLDWCCHGSRFGNTTRDHAGVAKLLLRAGARPANNAEASPAVLAVLTAWAPTS